MKIFSLVSIIFIFNIISCNTSCDEKAKRLIEKNQISEAEQLLKENKIENKILIENLLYEKLSANILLAAKRGDCECIKGVFLTHDFSEEQYNEICTKIYGATKNYNILFELLNSGLPVNSYCCEDTLLCCAVKNQNVENVIKLIQMNADVNLKCKNNLYNPLYLSIQYKTAQSFDIFKILLDHTNVSNDDFFKYSSDDELSVSGWYFERLIKYDQKEMFDHFYNNPEYKKLIYSNSYTLKVLADNNNYSKYVDNDIFNTNLRIDSEYDYFWSAISHLNYEIIPFLMDMHISPFISGEDCILNFLEGPHYMGVYYLDTQSENYPKLMALKPALENYIVNWR